LILFS